MLITGKIGKGENEEKEREERQSCLAVAGHESQLEKSLGGQQQAMC